MPQGFISSQTRHGFGGFPRVGYPPSGAPTYEELIADSGTEGEEVVIDTGATYTYSETTGIGWIRKEAYDAKDSDLARIAYAAGDTTTTPGFTQYTYASGTITSDGTHLILDTSGGGSLARSYIFENTTPDGADRLFQAYAQVTYQNTYHPSGGVMLIRDGAKETRLTLNRTANSAMRLTNTADTVLGTVHANENCTTVERFIEVFTNYGGTTYVFVDHSVSAVLSATNAQLTTNGNEIFAIGDYAIGFNEDCTVKVREVKAIRLT